MTASDILKIERGTWIKAARSRVWRALTNIEEFSKWFSVRAEGKIATGNRVTMTSTYPGHEGIQFSVAVEAMRPEEYFSWRWTPGADAASDPGRPSTLVEFHLRDAQGGTMVTVTESGFDRISLERRAAIVAENELGWEIQMASLERYAGAKE